MNRLKFRQVECFLEVCRDFHFTRAAERLNLAQPPLSRHIRELENLLGVRLFDRRGKTVSLTSAGKAFLEEVQVLPGLLNRAVDGARRAASGQVEHLRIGFVGAILGGGLLEVFHEYRKRYVDTRLQLFDLPPQELLGDVENGKLDGVFLGVKPHRLPDALECHHWRMDQLMVCLPREHALAGRSRLTLEDISRENLVVLSSRIAPSYRELLGRLYRSHGYRPHIAQETNASPAMLSMVAAGCGIALLPRSATASAQGRLAVVKLNHADAKIEEVFVCGRYPSEPVKRLIGTIGGD